MLRLSVFLLAIFSGSALPKKVWKSFRVPHDQTRMPLPAHPLTHQNQPRVYPPPTLVSFLPFHASTWHSLCLEFSLSRWKSHFRQAASLLSWADYDLPMAVNLGLLPSSLHPCNYLGERAGVHWWAGGPVSRAGDVCSQLDTQMCSWLILTLPRNDIPSCIKWLAKTLSAPFLRVTKRFEWCQWQEHFVRRIISFAYIQKIIHHYSDRQDWVERARPRLWFVTDKISTSLSVYHVLWSYLIFTTSESGLREV